MYTWNKDWIWNYQSVWCTIEKIKYSNSINGSQIKKYLDSRPVKNMLYDFESIYVSKYRFDKEKLIELCKKNIFLILNDEVKDILGFIYNRFDIEKYLINDLRICPECIKYGYHSIFHQLNLFNKCTFHNIPLEDTCPNCGKSYTYNLRYDDTHGFICKCGYNYLETDNFCELIKIWNSNSSIKCNIMNVDNPNIISFFTSFDFFINKYFNKKRDYFLKDNTFISNYIFKSNVFNKNDIYKFEPVFYNIKIPTLGDKKVYSNSNHIIIDQYIKVFECIARHFRKKVKKKNYKFYFSKYIYFTFNSPINNKASSDSKIKYKGIDEYLYAYIMWRKNIEGLEYYNQIHTPKVSSKIFNILTNYDIYVNYNRVGSIANTIFYQYISNELKQYILFCKKKDYKGFDDIGVLISALERIIGDILIKYFYDWLDFIRDKKKNCPNEKINFCQNIDFKFNNYFLCYDKVNRVGHIIKG